MSTLILIPTQYILQHVTATERIEALSAHGRLRSQHIADYCDRSLSINMPPTVLAVWYIAFGSEDLCENGIQYIISRFGLLYLSGYLFVVVDIWFVTYIERNIFFCYVRLEGSCYVTNLPYVKYTHWMKDCRYSCWLYTEDVKLLSFRRTYHWSIPSSRIYIYCVGYICSIWLWAGTMNIETKELTRRYAVSELRCDVLSSTVIFGTPSRHC